MTDKRDPSSDLAFDLLTGGLRMGANEQRVGDPADAEQVYGAYLSLLYAVRGARRGEEIPLRSADLDFLLVVVGEDPDQIERRLVELMGCTAEEASLLRRVLVRHRAVAASVGVAASLSLVALFGPAVASATSAPVPAAPAPSSVVPADPTELPPLTSYLTTDDGEHVPVPDAWNEEPATAEPAPVETVTVASVPAPAVVAPPASSAAAPVSSSSTTTPPPARAAAPAPATTATTPSSTTAPAEPSQAEPEAEVVLGEPMAPIDRPGWSPEDEVVLGEPMAPIDRPGWSPEDEVVLGEPMTPVDRPGWSPEGEVVLGEPMAPIDRVEAAPGEAESAAPN